MKKVLHILILLAVTALTLDALSNFSAKNSTEESLVFADVDDDFQSEDGDPDTEGDDSEDNSPAPVEEELICEHFEGIVFRRFPVTKKTHFNKHDNHRGSHIISPPYSPPEM